MTNTAYTFGALTFANSEELTQYCESLRLSCQPGTLIEGADNHALLSNLFNVLLRNRDRLKGQDITGWTTEQNTAGTHGLAAIREDGQRVSFSVKAAITAYSASLSAGF